jgi:hypothetical protein
MLCNLLDSLTDLLESYFIGGASVKKLTKTDYTGVWSTRVVVRERGDSSVLTGLYEIMSWEVRTVRVPVECKTHNFRVARRI